MQPIQLLEAATRLREYTRSDASFKQGAGVLPYDKALIKSQQRILYLNYAWPHLRVRVQKPLVAGSYKYDLPSGIDSSRITSFHVSKADGYYYELDKGIDTHDFNLYDTLQDERLDRPYKWDWEYDHATNKSMFTVWPIPDNSDYTAHIQGLKPLGTFERDTDYSTLDGELLVLYAVAAAKQAANAKDAGVWASQASNYLSQLKSGAEGGTTPIPYGRGGRTYGRTYGTGVGHTFRVRPV